MDYSKMLKAELVAECELRGLETTGLVTDLVIRLQADDLAKEVTVKVAPVAKKRVWNSMLFRYETK